MTGLQLYFLLAPFGLVAGAGAVAWWVVRHT
jgi:hypothetical protein